MATYIYKNNEQIGPIEDDQILAGLHDRTFAPEDLCWQEGMQDWKPLSQMFPIPPSPPPPPPPSADHGGKPQSGIPPILIHYLELAGSFLSTLRERFIALDHEGKKKALVKLAVCTILLFGGLSWCTKSHFTTSASSTAIVAAQQIVRDSLKSPSSAVFQETTILDKKGNKYLVKTVLDAQNAFGAMIRGKYIVVLTLTGGTKFEYNTTFGAMEVKDYSEKYVIDLAKQMNSWDESSKK